MKEQEKQIEEIRHIVEMYFEDRLIMGSNDLARKLYKIAVPENSVVLSREEMERLSSSHDIVFCDNKDCSDNLLCRCCEISECPKNIPEYNEKLSANKYKLELFQKLCKERERADSWEDRYKLLEEELKQEHKETVEKIIMDFYHELFESPKGRVITYGSFCEIAQKHNIQIPQETFTVAQQYAENKRHGE